MSFLSSSPTKNQFSKSTSSSSLSVSPTKDSKWNFTKNKETTKDKSKYKNRSRSNSPPQISPTIPATPKFNFSLAEKSTVVEKSTPIEKSHIKKPKPVLTKTELESNNDIKLIDSPEVKIETANVNINLYNSKCYIITTIKAIVFQNYAFISGDFNTQQFIIAKNIDKFTTLITNYEKNNNNIKLSHDQIYNLFTDESIFPETNKRLQLQKSMDIIINKNKFLNFIKDIKSYFYNNNYKLNYENKGNFKNSAFKNTILFEDDINIYLHIITIIDLVNNTSFNINLIIMENKKKENDSNYVLPLNIPYGLYDSEHLYITNNGNDTLNIHYGKSTIQDIKHNIDETIISLIPKVNDMKYDKLVKYAYNSITSLSSENKYMFEFDLLINKINNSYYNKESNENKKKETYYLQNTHKKSDFLLTNKLVSKDSLCVKCDCCIMINSKYVIAKCCKKLYHIECMDMNYIPNIYYKNIHSYFICDCGFSNNDYFNCNTDLLHKLYIDYYTFNSTYAIN
jgi:hypothetical protein